MQARHQIIAKAGNCIREEKLSSQEDTPLSQLFATKTFDVYEMKQRLPKDVCDHLLNAMAGRKKLCSEHANTIACAMKEWALSHGATHYSHWFQPLTGASAEKQDTFTEFTSSGQLIERFDGKQLLQGEPDASSFPSGGLRSTYEARGYTGWDPSTPPFLWKAGDGVTLCIPSIFFSWTGEVLDSKIPLLRSDQKLNTAVQRLGRLLNQPIEQAFSTLGCEQEYFVVDRCLRNLRPDLVGMGRTVFGAPSAKGQELQDHYFGTVKDRILTYMRDFELRALELGIPVKTRHNEVAPAQHEVACLYERAVRAVDHNILLMEVMRQTALDHDLSCLLDEKPFAGINGSGKHNNWSVATSDGENLLDPCVEGEPQALRFTILLTAVLWGVYQHAALLRASVGSASNDHRLGGHEAPPAIISVYLGEALEQFLHSIEDGKLPKEQKGKGSFDFGLNVLANLPKDDTDRNRTSPFAFTGAKFEFRAVGSLASCALPITVINAIVADSLDQIIGEIEPLVAEGKELESAVLEIVQKYLKQSKPIRFSGDNYAESWQAEAANRKLPCYPNALQAYPSLAAPSSVSVFKGIFLKKELESLSDILTEQYLTHLLIEQRLMSEIFQTQLLPAILKTQTEQAKAIAKTLQALPSANVQLLKEQLTSIVNQLEQALQKQKELEAVNQELEEGESLSRKVQVACDKALPLMQEFRRVVDQLERITSDEHWPLPKYRELLLLVQ